MNTRAVHRACLWMLLLCVATAGSAAADPIAEAIAHPARSQADRERDRRSHPAETLALLGVGPGDQVIDLFAGGGYYTELLAHVVGATGRVVAYNNPPYARFIGQELAGRLADERLPQVTLYEAAVADFEPPAPAFDRALFILSYHDLYWESERFNWPKMDADAFLARVAAALRPGGRVLVVDHAAKDGTGAGVVDALHRIEEQFVVERFARQGLVKVGSSDVLRNTADPRDVPMSDEAIRGRTDRFVLVFEKQP